jgi:hypothetical protein
VAGAVAAGQPSWLIVGDGTLAAASGWLDTPSRRQAPDYRRGDAEILARPQARTAPDELALPGIGPGLIGQDRQLPAQQSEDLQHLDRSAWAVTSR